MSTYEISKSSLLSLKAEILRKQDEVNKAKLHNKAKAVQEPKKGTPLELKNKGVEERQRFDFVEDVDLLKKSRDVLEEKAKLYAQLSKGKKIEGSERFLVQFGRKLTYAKPPDDSDEEDYNRYPESDEERHFSDEYEPPKNREDEWVEYTDCLGRTRKCLRKDLEYIKEKDSDLKSTIGRDDNRDNGRKVEEKVQETKSEDPGQNFDENSELLSSDMRTELLRQKWEKEEEELRKKSDVHYQDILFDEARVHGVGYYGFSKDEKERARQQEALKKLRQETQQQQKKADDVRKLRDKQLAVRAKAARNRKRARMGLPPEEDEEEETKQEPKPEIIEPEKSLEEIENEKKREEQRKNHVRPWDIGKDGVKEHVELTQEEWVHKKRKERDNEFAPPSLYKDKKEEDYIDISRPPPKINNPSKRRINPYKNYDEDRRPEIKKQNPKPIVNEYVDSDDELLKDYNSSKRQEKKEEEKRGRGVEVAPPLTFDYYGPSSSKKSKSKAKNSEFIEESISAGLEYLRKQAEKKGRNRDQDMFIM